MKNNDAEIEKQIALRILADRRSMTNLNFNRNGEN